MFNNSFAGRGIDDISLPRKNYAFNFKHNTPRELTPQDLDEISISSENYFAKHLPASHFRLRLPEDTTADFKDCIDSSHQEIRTAVAQSSNSILQQGTQIALRQLSACVRVYKYEDLKMLSEKLGRTKYASYAHIFLYIAAIKRGSYINEIEALRLIEKDSFSEDNLPHFYHLIDELVTLPDNRHITMTSFISPDKKSIIAAFLREPHVIPLLSPTKSDLFSSKQVPKYQKEAYLDKKWSEAKKAEPIPLDRLCVLTEVAKSTIPMMQIAVTTPKVKKPAQEPKDQSIVTKSLTTGKYADTIKYATSFIERNINTSEMYVYRSLAFYKLNNIPAAVHDITESIKMDVTDNKLRIRAAFYLKAGEPILALHDINDNNNKEDILDIINYIASGSFIGDFNK